MHTLALSLYSILTPFIIPSVHATNQGSYSTVTDVAEKVSSSFMVILVISVILLVLVTAFMLYFAIRYRAGKNPEPEEVRESLSLEIIWTVIPTIIVLVMFYVGWANFVPLRNEPEASMPVKVMARMWGWQFEYENGLKSRTLNVPVNTSVKLAMTSQDVIHSLFIPAFKIKEDLVPGMETNLWFHADRKGEHDIFCAEYCGKGHSSMNSKVVVMPEDEFNTWYSAAEVKKVTALTPAQTMNLLDDQGCLDCHSLDGSVVEGPSFKGIFGRKTVVITGGKEREIVSDENYLKDSILSPDSDIVKDYEDIMPSFEGELSDNDIDSIIRLFKTLK